MAIFEYNKKINDEKNFSPKFDVLFVMDFPLSEQKPAIDESYFDIKKYSDYDIQRVLWVETPYTDQDGRPLIGYAHFGLINGREGRYDMNGAWQEELWVEDDGIYKNLTYDIYIPSNFFNFDNEFNIYDEDGEKILFDDALKEMTRFAKMASKKDHVLSYSEWRFENKAKIISLQSRGIDIDDLPKEDEYYNYLNDMLSDMSDVVGNIKNIDDMIDKLYHNEDFQHPAISLQNFHDDYDYYMLDYTINRLRYDAKSINKQTKIASSDETLLRDADNMKEAKREDVEIEVRRYLDTLSDDMIRGLMSDLMTKDDGGVEVASNVRNFQSISVDEMKQKLVDNTVEYWVNYASVADLPLKENIEKWINESLNPDSINYYSKGDYGE